MKCRLLLGQYDDNNRLAIEVQYWNEATGDEPGEWDTWGVITKNLSRAYAPADTDKHAYVFLASDEFPRVVETLAQAGLGVYTGTIGLNGQCSYPLFRFDKQALDDFIKNNKTIEL